jgi:hypothetical protein
MAKHRTYPIEFKRQLAQEYLAGENLCGLSRLHPPFRSRLAVGANRNGGLSMMVRVEGLEPPCPCERWILSPLRLPFRHTRPRPAPFATAAGRASLQWWGGAGNAGDAGPPV